MSEKIKDAVKKAYTEVVTNSDDCGCATSCCTPSEAIKDDDCCETSCCSPNEGAKFNESYEQIDGYQKDADFGLGCGIPTEFAKIKEGDIVLDLGSGAGNDVFVARSIVGDKGQVIGVDMTEAMIAKANKNKQKLGFDNVEFVLGEIENLPLQNDTIDVALSNCVMNLVPNKVKAYSEVYRILKSGGYFSISDIVLNGTLPAGIKNAAKMYVGCVAGALSKEEYLDAIKKAGFKNISVVKERKMTFSDELLLKYINQEELNQYKNSQSTVMSITVYADK